MHEEISTNVLWFMGGLIFTFWILFPIAKAAGRPDLVFYGGAIYAVIWLSITFTLHMML
ncbi:hypothetical protein ACLUU9_09010 (plasmid) [Rothia mucilaginosa]|uniref:hypothetical protein n=1 Tax=Rothia mucilaginosa TaxID=43675 RepID=UPI0039A0915F